MKFIAILKDSLREALDSWIIYVMFAFSGIMTLLVASVSFRPVPVQEDVESLPRLLNFLVNLSRTSGQTMPKGYAVENFAQTNGASEPWNGDYAFDFVVHLDKAEDKDAIKKNAPHLLFSERELKRSLEDELYYLENLNVKEVTQNTTEVRFHVTSKGTKIKDKRGWNHEPKILFSVPLGIKTPIERLVYYVEKWLVHKVGAWIAVLIGIVITAFFVPNLMRKGSIDLLVSKPIHRVTLLLYKYVGGLLFMLLTTTLTVGGIWFVLGLRTSIWGPGFLLVIPAVVFYFAILYAVSVLLAVLTRSPIVAILGTILAGVVFYLNGVTHNTIEAINKSNEQIRKTEEDAERNPFRKSDEPPNPTPSIRIPKVLQYSSDFFYAVLPRANDLDDLTNKLIIDSVLSDVEKKKLGLTEEKYPPWNETVVVSSLFIILIMGLACWRFATRDY